MSSNDSRVSFASESVIGIHAPGKVKLKNWEQTACFLLELGPTGSLP